MKATIPDGLRIAAHSSAEEEPGIQKPSRHEALGAADRVRAVRDPDQDVVAGGDVGASFETALRLESPRTHSRPSFHLARSARPQRITTVDRGGFEVVVFRSRRSWERSPELIESALDVGVSPGCDFRGIGSTPNLHRRGHCNMDRRPRPAPPHSGRAVDVDSPRRGRGSVRSGCRTRHTGLAS